MKIILVRHGESEGNISHLVQGAMSKSNLTSVGREQTSKLAERLATTKIDLAFVSPLDRARQTAEIILKNHSNTKIEFSDQLKEKDAGVFAGRPGSDFIEAWQASGLDYGEFQPEDGESWYQSGERVVGFVKGLIDQYKDSDNTILVVGHGSIFTYLLMWADKFDPKSNTKEDYDHYHPANTAVAIIESEKNSFYELVSFNDTSHLE